MQRQTAVTDPWKSKQLLLLSLHDGYIQLFRDKSRLFLLRQHLCLTFPCQAVSTYQAYVVLPEKSEIFWAGMHFVVYHFNIIVGHTENGTYKKNTQYHIFGADVILSTDCKIVKCSARDGL